MIFKAWKMLELPAPVRVGQGMFDAWRDDCRRAWLIEKMATDPADEIAMSIQVPPDLDTNFTLTALAWADRLVREEVLEPGRIILEYGLKRTCPFPGKMTVALSVYGRLASRAAQAPPEDESEAA